MKHAESQLFSIDIINDENAYLLGTSSRRSVMLFHCIQFRIFIYRVLGNMQEQINSSEWHVQAQGFPPSTSHAKEKRTWHVIWSCTYRVRHTLRRQRIIWLKQSDKEIKSIRLSSAACEAKLVLFKAVSTQSAQLCTFDWVPYDCYYYYYYYQFKPAILELLELRRSSVKYVTTMTYLQNKDFYLLSAIRNEELACQLQSAKTRGTLQPIVQQMLWFSKFFDRRSSPVLHPLHLEMWNEMQLWISWTTLSELYAFDRKLSNNLLWWQKDNTVTCSLEFTHAFSCENTQLTSSSASSR